MAHQTPPPSVRDSAPARLYSIGQIGGATFLGTPLAGNIRRHDFWLGLLVLVILGVLALGVIFVLSLAGPFMVSGVVFIIGPIVATVILLYSG